MAVAVLGAGPHGRQIAHDLKTDALYDDNLPGYAPVVYGAQRHHWVIGAVWPQVRRQIAAKVAVAQGSEVTVEAFHDGVVRFPTAYVGVDIELGAHVHLLPHSTVSHGCRLGDFVTVCSGAVLCGEVVIDDDVFIGAGAVVIHGGIKIGQGAKIGAGAVVTRDVPPGACVKGIPAA